MSTWGKVNTTGRMANRTVSLQSIRVSGFVDERQWKKATGGPFYSRKPKEGPGGSRRKLEDESDKKKKVISGVAAQVRERRLRIKITP